jgi:hypothetical protein
MQWLIERLASKFPATPHRPMLRVATNEIKAIHNVSKPRRQRIHHRVYRKFADSSNLAHWILNLS